MRVHLLLVPYDSGMRGARMGAGPERLLAAGIAERLASDGHAVTTETIELPPDFFAAEVQAAFEINRRLAAAVKQAVARGALPLVLAGNCNTALGTLAGLGRGDVGIAWFDAHGDFNTPETSVSGFFDGMALATATGRCWTKAAATIPGFSAVPDERVMHFGARDFDEDEEPLMDGTRVRRFSAARVRQGIRASLLSRSETVDGVYLHIDLDVLDTDEGKANGYAIPDGVTRAELEFAIREITDVFSLRAAALTAYDPAFDDDGRIAQTAIGLASSIAACLDARSDGRLD